MTTKTPREVIAEALYCDAGKDIPPLPDGRPGQTPWADQGDDFRAHWLARVDVAVAALTSAGYTVEKGWQPIETAPKVDGKPVLLLIGDERARIEIGRWDPDQYTQRPRPFWSYSRRCTSDRQHPPTHWRPLPAPPAEKNNGNAG